MLKIPSLKHKYKHLPFERLPAPAVFHLPLESYKVELTPLVAIGTKVLKYQKVAASDGIFGSAIHAPASGTITEIIFLEGKKHLVLTNDFLDETTAVKPLNLSDLSLADFVAILRENGLEGSGGARFPTALKYSVDKHNIQTLIINAAECEPFLTADYGVLFHEAAMLFQVIQLIAKKIEVPQIVIALERHNADLKSIILAKAKEFSLPVSITILPDSYPQGGELQLIYAVTGTKYPKGTVPAQQGILVSNVGTIRAMYRAVYEGKPYTERVVTLYDDFQKVGQNFLVAIGTPLNHMITHSFLNETSNMNNSIYILGGPMMGKTSSDLQLPIHKGSGGLMHFPKPNVIDNPCISCGYCADVCPQHLLPMDFVRFVYTEETPKLKEYHLMDCIECGACAYICPSNVPLMGSIYEGKKRIIEL